ncbi:RNA polymerase sporulation-specific sigma factor [Sporobacter termitidis DSM 10068]|uniref:RNA polymerase sigma factor SigS n=2 Tax=Sporobacter TaxID=44748 RepID=A0A1M5UGJ0_9FIRM|nr:RNA polymerase sporulation-specific sigma factor [Sporobacter termitidis DSM 10068]
MSNFYNNRDVELWSMASSGDVKAEEELISEYSRLVKICARPYFLAGGDSEDLIQEGMLGLLSAVRHYDPARDVRFKTYAEFCIRRRLYSAIKSASRFKHIPLNDYVSLESPELDENGTLGMFFLRDPEESVIARERVDEITDCLYGSLSRFESRILGLYLEGMSYEEMAAKVNKTPKSVDNAVQRIRKKLAQYLKYGDNQ